MDQKKARLIIQSSALCADQGRSCLCEFNTNGLFAFLIWQHRQQATQPPHKARRIVELTAFGQQRLLEQQFAPICDVVIVDFVFQSRDQHRGEMLPMD